MTTDTSSANAALISMNNMDEPLNRARSLALALVLACDSAHMNSETASAIGVTIGKELDNTLAKYSEAWRAVSQIKQSTADDPDTLTLMTDAADALAALRQRVETVEKVADRVEAVEKVAVRTVIRTSDIVDRTVRNAAFAADAASELLEGTHVDDLPAAREKIAAFVAMTLEQLRAAVASIDAEEASVYSDYRSAS